jgi:hypothetical protein
MGLELDRVGPLPQTFVELLDWILREHEQCKRQGLPCPSAYHLEVLLGLDPTFPPPADHAMITEAAAAIKVRDVVLPAGMTRDCLDALAGLFNEKAGWDSDCDKSCDELAIEAFEVVRASLQWVQWDGALRLRRLRAEFERRRRLGLPAPVWSDLDRIADGLAG